MGKAVAEDAALAGAAGSAFAAPVLPVDEVVSGASTRASSMPPMESELVAGFSGRSSSVEIASTVSGCRSRWRCTSPCT
ncbi:MAG: hypothetical protein B7Y95_21255 [Rhizobiales bacterium 32-66-11]|nr:MAG: hypothetical protein B7Y95_21255 [Rhizobiales bacterium 32-66-11]